MRSGRGDMEMHRWEEVGGVDASTRKDESLAPRNRSGNFPTVGQANLTRNQRRPLRAPPSFLLSSSSPIPPRCLPRSRTSSSSSRSAVARTPAVRALCFYNARACLVATSESATSARTRAACSEKSLTYGSLANARSSPQPRASRSRARRPATRTRPRPSSSRSAASG